MIDQIIVVNMDDDADDNNHHKGQTSTLVEYLLTAVYKTTMMLKVNKNSDKILINE